MLHKFTQRHDVGAVPNNKTSLHIRSNEASCIVATLIKECDIKLPIA